jgi:hypothetical protein
MNVPVMTETSRASRIGPSATMTMVKARMSPGGVMSVYPTVVIVTRVW